MKIKFGKYKGLKLDQVPSDYLLLIVYHCKGREIRFAAVEEYIYREDNGCHFWEKGE